MEINWEILLWDSDLFHYKVAKINETTFGSIPNGILKSLYNNNIKLAYYSSAQKLAINKNDFYDIKFVDRKVTYLKEIENINFSDKIEYYTKDYPEEKLIKLSINSGIFSRFNTDIKIGRKNFEALYTQWIINSVKKKIADEVLIYKEKKQIEGFVTLGNKNNRADIGIIAVDACFKGRGIGKALMLSAEARSSKNYNFIQVVTQEDNLPACKLYESCGYKIDKVEFFYHFWKID
jgi:dTDP-4-amino-4,6-dideoxy-D-galactose acyltransferase